MAKGILRDIGAPKVASRIGRLSNKRNADARPDVDIIPAVQNAFMYQKKLDQKISGASSS